MGLHRKFLLLLGVVAMTVIATFGAALWAVSLLDREVAQPMRGVYEVTRDLRGTKRLAEDAARALPEPEADGASLASRFGLRHDPTSVSGPVGRPFEEIANVLEETAARLRDDPRYDLLIGTSATENLVRRVERAVDGGREYLVTGQADVLRSTSEDLYLIHELIERIEGRIIENVGLSAEFGRMVRKRVMIVVSLSMLAVVFAGWLGMHLVRRWILDPVGDLHDATDQFALGEFHYRVEPRSDDEMGQLCVAVNEMAGTIANMQQERIDRERLAAIGEMTGRIVHNLRNPLAGIRNLAELSRLDAQSGTPLAENQTRIIGAVDRFEQWLTELLEATRPLELTLMRTDVRTWLEQTIEPHRAIAESKQVIVDVDLTEAPPSASFDSRRLEHAVVAVLTNAIQASPEQGTVGVTARRRPKADRWRIEISDQGPGIPAEIRSQIFQPYFTTKRGGTGIGLAFCRQIVELHGGTVEIMDSNPGSQGTVNTVVAIDLPLGDNGKVANTGQDGN